MGDIFAEDEEAGGGHSTTSDERYNFIYSYYFRGRKTFFFEALDFFGKISDLNATFTHLFKVQPLYQGTLKKNPLLTSIFSCAGSALPLTFTKIKSDSGTVGGV